MKQSMTENLKIYGSSQSPRNDMTELTPYSKPGGYLIGTVVFALFWNIIFLILYKNMYSKNSIILLMVLFIAVDVYLFITFCYFLGSYRQPRLKVSNKCPRIGETVTLAWELPDYRSITRLVITLEGFEHMDVPLYDAPYTCRNAIASIILTDTTEIPEIKTGSAEFKIPWNSMHSFDDGRFQIVWQLKLHAEKAWKDRRIKYIINVQPYEV
ncbi:MAG: hypothetical protein WCI51_03925 [Lentisphaerota bacterium]